MSCSSTGHGGISSHVQRLVSYGLVSSQLLLQVIAIIPNLRCGNVASILELDENLGKQYKIFEAAP